MHFYELNYNGKILLINLYFKYGVEGYFSEKIDAFSRVYNVKLSHVYSLFSTLEKYGFLDRKRCYSEDKKEARFKYKFDESLNDWIGEQCLLCDQIKRSDFKFFLQEMENRYPNANRTIPADQRWLLLILIAHQDEFGTVTHLTIKDLCYLMGGIREDRFKRIQKKAVEAKLISVLKTSATFFNEVKNVYVLKGVKGKKIKVTATEIKVPSVPYLPSVFKLFYKLYVYNMGFLSKEKVYSRIVFSWQEDIVCYKEMLPDYVDDLLKRVLSVDFSGVQLLYDKYLNSSSTDTSELMHVKLNRLATLILNRYSSELNNADENWMPILLAELSNDKEIIHFLKWDTLLSKGMLNTMADIPIDRLTAQQKKCINLSKSIDDGQSLTGEQVAAFNLYARTVQGMVAFSLCIAQQCHQFLQEHGHINMKCYEHIIDVNFYVPRNLPMVTEESHSLFTIHSYTSSHQDQELYHTIKYQGVKGKKIGIFTYERTMIESTLIT